jgi:hypothetical protein
MPRSIAEVNAIRDSNRSPSAEGELPGDGRDGFDPNQPRVPAGHSDGGQWTSTGADGPASSRREVELDDTGEEAWESVTSTYRPDGTLAEQEVVNRDGGRIHSQFSLDRRMAGWDERHTVTLPDGRQITFESSGDVQTIYDADGQPISASEWTSEGPVPHPMVQLARGKPGGGLFTRSAPGIGPGAGEASPSLVGAAAAVLFTWLSNQNSRGGATVLAFKAGDYRNEGTKSKPEIALVRRLTRDEVGDFCKKLENVQDLTDKAVRQVRKDDDYMGAADFGTKVHKMIADGINNQGKPDYRAEKSGFKSSWAKAKYGQKDSIRIDAYENLAEISTACIYDPKTGERGLSLPRMLELAQTAYRLFKSKQIIVIEVRPSQE